MVWQYGIHGGRRCRAPFMAVELSRDDDASPILNKETKTVKSLPLKSFN